MINFKKFIGRMFSNCVAEYEAVAAVTKSTSAAAASRSSTVASNSAEQASRGGSSMTVADLIAHLQQLSGDLPVVCCPEGHRFFDCHGPSIHQMVKMTYSEWDEAPKDGAGVDVVLL